MRNTTYNEEKRKPISPSAVARIVIWSVVLVLLLGVFSAAMLADGSGVSIFRMFWDGWDYDDDQFNVGNGVVRTPIHELSIDWVAGNVTVGVTDGEEILITEDYDGEKQAYRMRWQVEDGELAVKCARPSNFGMDIVSKNLEVLIPESMLNSLEEIHVSTVSAAQDIRVSAQELDVETVSGSVTISGEYTSVEAETFSGDLHFEGSTKECSFDGFSARAEIRLKEPANLVDMETMSGYLKLILPNHITGFKVTSNNLSGNTEIRGFDVDGGKSSSWGDESMRIRMDGVSGKLIIEKEIIG